MTLIKTVVLCLFFLAIAGCQKQKNPEIHQIRFGTFDRKPAGNQINKGWRFLHFMQIDLNTDSIILKQNQLSLEDYLNGPQVATYYTGKIPPELNKEMGDFRNYALHKNSGPKFENAHEFSGVIYCGPLTFLEYKKDTLVRYFYIKFDPSDPLYDSLLGGFSETLYDFAVGQISLKPAKPNYHLDDDSLVAQLVNRNDFSENVPPPPVQRTIKFTPPVKK